MQLSDDGVFVVARVADAGGAVGRRVAAAWVARQVVEVDFPFRSFERRCCVLPGGLTMPSSILSPSRGAGRS